MPTPTPAPTATPTPAPTPVPTPSPTPAPSCSGNSYSGSLNGAGSSVYYSYTTSVSGTHRGTLTGPANANFNLYLEKQSLIFWTTVATSAGTTSTENIAYSGTAGNYRWSINSASGSGNYTFCSVRP